MEKEIINTKDMSEFGILFASALLKGLKKRK